MIRRWEYQRLVAVDATDAKLAHLGFLGWELVAIIPGIYSGGAATLYFKREIAA